jgi:hypothetical protein
MRDFETYPNDGSFDESKSPDISAWKLARANIEHENNLVNQRLTWLLASQTVLFSAFGLLFLASAKTGELINSAQVPVDILLTALGLFALYFCFAISIALEQAFEAIDSIADWYEKLGNDHPGFGKRLGLLWFAILNALLLYRFPDLTLCSELIFCIACVVLGAVSIRFVHSTRTRGRSARK